MSDSEAYQNHFIHRTASGLFWFSEHEDGAGGPLVSFPTPEQARDGVKLWIECGRSPVEFERRWNERTL